MGGPGSGNWVRRRAQATTGDLRRLDVRDLARGGALVAGARGHLAWPDAGAVGFAARAAPVEGAGPVALLVLDYRERRGGGAWEDRREVLGLAWTDCHYGGRRPWFVCPGCGRRAAVLYLGGAGWRCRGCERLVYRSQRQGPPDRALTTTQRIRLRLGGSASLVAPFPPRPPRMHRRTYERLRREAAAAEGVYDAAAWAGLARTGRRLGIAVAGAPARGRGTA